MKERFDKFSEEYAKFENIQMPLNLRPDLCAFLLLDKLCPGNTDIVSAVEHDVIFLDVDMERLAAVASDEDIKTLVRCGVRCEGDWLEMFV